MEKEKYSEQLEAFNKTYSTLLDAYENANGKTEVARIILENGKGCILKKDVPFSAAKKCMNILVGGSDDLGIVDAGEIILDACWIAGDMEIEKATKDRLSAAIQAAQLFEMYQGEIKKN